MTLEVFCSIIGSIIVAGFSFLGVRYQSNKHYEKNQLQLDTDRQLLQKEFEGYKAFLKEVNKNLQMDIQTLSERVEKHNEYGRKIPAIEKDIEHIKERLDNIEK